MNGRDYGAYSISGSTQWQEKASWILCYIRRMAKFSLLFGSPEAFAVGVSGLVSDEAFSVLKSVFNQCAPASSWQMFHLTRILLLGINPSQDLNCMMAFRNIEVCLPVFKSDFIFISFYVDRSSGKGAIPCRTNMWHRTKQARRELPC